MVAPYGFERETVEGSDVPAVHDAFANYLDKARGGKGPYLLECLTFRRRGHYEGDPEKYRDPEAEREWAARDPIARFTLVDEETAPTDRARGRRRGRGGGAVRAREPVPGSASIAADLVYAK